MSKINEAIRSICFNSIFNVCRQPQIIISSLMVFVEVFFNLLFSVPARNILDHQVSSSL